MAVGHIRPRHLRFLMNHCSSIRAIYLKLKPESRIIFIVQDVTPSDVCGVRYRPRSQDLYVFKGPRTAFSEFSHEPLQRRKSHIPQIKARIKDYLYCIECNCIGFLWREISAMFLEGGGSYAVGDSFCCACQNRLKAACLLTQMLSCIFL